MENGKFYRDVEDQEQRFCDKNLRFHLPISIETSAEYQSKLEEQLNKYIKEIKRPSFDFIGDSIKEVESICERIIKISKLSLKDKKEAEKDEKEAEKIKKKQIKILKEILADFSLIDSGDNSFIISELDKCYAFKGIAPFMSPNSTDYNSYNYEEMCQENATFFRTRITKKTDNSISKKVHITSLPYDKKKLAEDGRFNVKGEPGLYLGTTSFVCAKECGWSNQGDEDLYGAAFVPTEKGKKLKILNLAISPALFNGCFGDIDKSYSPEKKDLLIQMLKLFPIIIATSFTTSCPCKTDEEKYEYTISQLLMQIINDSKIDGIAYLSMQGCDEFQYPQGVNLAFPASDTTKDNPISKYCYMFEMSEPFKFDHQKGGKRKSYINKCYPQYEDIENKKIECFSSKVDIDGKEVFYGDTDFSKFDDFLLSQELDIININKDC